MHCISLSSNNDTRFLLVSVGGSAQPKKLVQRCNSVTTEYVSEAQSTFVSTHLHKYGNTTLYNLQNIALPRLRTFDITPKIKTKSTLYAIFKLFNLFLS